mmetsp:Transcript_24267/g.52973  ORF Transcript_24267/g.52973 Transcript_24267/m.52973 type:complete len:410 (-) Transcript_24267:149-1378(-)
MKGVLCAACKRSSVGVHAGSLAGRFVEPSERASHLLSRCASCVCGRPGICCTSDQQVFGRLVRDDSLPYPGLVVPRGSGRIVRAANGTIALGALPLALFMHGHAYMVQSAHLRLGVRPFAVHATYSLDKHDHTAKIQRFREAGLWAVDTPEDPNTRFLALNFSVSPATTALIERFGAQREAASNIAVHLQALRGYVAELRDALALARALGRTLVLPAWTCYCDKLWSGSDDIFHFGCMYPGSQDGHFVPFVCPMDHVLSPSSWRDVGVSYRDARFAESMDGRSVVDVQLLPEGSKLSLGSLPLGLSDAAAAGALAPLAHKTVLRLPHARGLLCGLEAEANADMAALSAKLLRPPEWCSTCFRPCADELSRWLDAAAISAGADGANRWCARVDPPRPLPAAIRACRSGAS